MTDQTPTLSTSLVDLPKQEWLAAVSTIAEEDGYFQKLGRRHFAAFIEEGTTLLVTFETIQGMHALSNLAQPLGWEMLRDHGWSHLCIASDGDTWFRDKAVYGYFDRLIDDGFFDEFDNVIFYGAGPCGYAAAAYSAAAPGSTVFAISPQSTLDKSIVPWEMRYKKAWSRDFSGPFGDASISSQAAKDVHIMFDPYVRPDAAHAARYTGDNVTFWRCPLLGHRLGSSLSQMGALQTIARKAIAGDLTAHEFHGLLRARHTFPRFQRELANLALDRGHPALAKQVCRHILRQRDDVYFRRMLKRLA